MPSWEMGTFRILVFVGGGVLHVCLAKFSECIRVFPIKDIYSNWSPRLFQRKEGFLQGQLDGTANRWTRRWQAKHRSGSYVLQPRIRLGIRGIHTGRGGGLNVNLRFGSLRSVKVRRYKRHSFRILFSFVFFWVFDHCSTHSTRYTYTVKEGLYGCGPVHSIRNLKYPQFPRIQRQRFGRHYLERG
jgi:hypothetical protein